VRTDARAAFPLIRPLRTPMTQPPAASPESTDPALTPAPGAPPRVATVTPPGPRPALVVSLRAVLIGLVLIPANTWWLAEIEYVRYSDNATTSSLFFNAVLFARAAGMALLTALSDFAVLLLIVLV